MSGSSVRLWYSTGLGREFATVPDVTGRTVRNDVERLRRLGYPVQASPGVGGGYRLGAGAALLGRPAPEFVVENAFSLPDAVMGGR